MRLIFLVLIVLCRFHFFVQVKSYYTHEVKMCAILDQSSQCHGKERCHTTYISQYYDDVFITSLRQCHDVTSKHTRTYNFIVHGEVIHLTRLVGTGSNAPGFIVFLCKAQVKPRTLILQLVLLPQIWLEVRPIKVDHSSRHSAFVDDNLFFLIR